MSDTQTIHVRVIQTKPSDWYTIVEKTVYTKGTWMECDGEQTLTMDNSGTSGMLRLKNHRGDYFLIALGVHNHKRWCDIVPDAKSSDTGVQIHPMYYTSGTNNSHIREQQLANLEKRTSNGVHIKVDYYKEDGKTYYATITIIN